MDTLLLHWIDDGHVAWRLGGVPGRGHPADAAPLARGRRVVLLVPGETVLLAHAAMPSRKPAEIARALPYALEEWLLEPPETQHFAWQRTPAGVAAAVVARGTLGHWLACLGATGIEPDVLLPDILALPWVEGRWSLLCESTGPDARLLLRSGRHDGLVCTRVNLLLVLAALLQRTPSAARPQTLAVWGFEVEEVTALGAGLVDFDVHVERHDAPADLLALVVEAALPDDFNLLQGAHAPRRAKARRSGPRRAIAIAAALWLLSVFAYAGVQAAVLARESQLLQGAIDAVFRAAVPGEHRIVDARAQLQQALGAEEHGRGAGGPLDLLSAVADARIDASGVRLQRLAYRDGRLDLTLQAPSAAALDAVQRALAAQGLRAELRDIGSVDGHAQGRIHIAGATP